MKKFNGTVVELLDNSEFIAQFEAARHGDFAAGGPGATSRKELIERISQAQFVIYTESRAMAHWLKLLDGAAGLDEKGVSEKV